MSYLSVKQSILSTVSSPPRTVNGRSVVLSTLLLTGLLAIVVPGVAILTGVSVLPLVAVAGLVYAVALVVTSNLFEGLCGAVFVLCTFQANVPILGVPQPGQFAPLQLSVMLVDIVAVPFAVLFSVWLSVNVMLPTLRSEAIAGYALAGFVVWAALAAIVSNGPSMAAAGIFAVRQARNLLLFGVAVAVVRYIGVRSAIYSLLTAVGGNMLFAFGEVLNRGSFGLSYLGDAAGITISTFYIGPIGFQASQYAGGLAGRSRVLLALVLLVTPVVIERIVNGPSRYKLLSLSYLLGSVFFLRVAETDAGLFAFLIVVFSIVVSLTYVKSTAKGSDSAAGTVDDLLGYGSAIGAGALSYLLYVGRTVSTEQSSEVSSGTDSSGGAGTSASTDFSTAIDTVTAMVKAVPLVNVANLSVRLQQYAAAIDIGVTYPLFGLGGLNFLFVAESYGLFRPIHMHNVYFSYLTGTGIPGITLFLTSILAVLVVAIKKTANTESDDRLLWAMVVCGMVGFHAFNFWVANHSVEVTYMVFWVFAGVIVGSSDDQKLRTSSDR